MSILFDEEQQLFTLHTAQTTYQMKVDAFGFLLHLYYGRRTTGKHSFSFRQKSAECMQHKKTAAFII